MKFHSYIFLTTKESFPGISEIDCQRYKQAFLEKIHEEKDVVVCSFTLLGLKNQTAIVLWMQCDSLIILQNHLNNLMHTSLGKHLIITHTLIGMTRPTQYSHGLQSHEDTARKGRQYLVIYPFTKTKEWYMLDFEQRKELMKGHIAIGRKYPQISQLLLYSFGIDDQEFIVSYETDKLEDFQELVMELRSDLVRAYTQTDTPIFTCVYRDIQETLKFL